MKELRVIGGRRSHDTLLAVLAACPPAKVLDAPAGTGRLACVLRDRGWEVSCADIDPGNFAAEGFPFERVDLNREIPYPSASFDAVVCANGLHRLFNPGRAIREFERVLRPGGRLHITVNNYASLPKRLRFLFYGSITNTINEGSFVQTIEAPEANFRNHLFYPQLAFLLEGAGLRIARVLPASVKPLHRALLPLAWLVYVGTWLIARKSARRNRVAVTRSRAICPGGKYLYIEARKPGPGEEGEAGRTPAFR